MFWSMERLLLVLLVLDAVLFLVVSVMGEMIRARRLEEARRRQTMEQQREAVRKPIDSLQRKRHATYE